MQRGRASLALWAAAAVVMPSVAAAAVVFQPNFGTVALTTPYRTTPTGALMGWPNSQAPTTSTSPSAPVSGGLSTRMDIEANPGTTPNETSPNVLRAEVQRGDRTTTGGTIKPRSEVLNTNVKSTYGDVIWYGLSVRLASNWQKNTAGDGRWTVLTQWKGVATTSPNGTEPPLELLAEGNNLFLHRQLVTGSGSHCDSVVHGGPCSINLGPLPIGTWTRLAFGVSWSTATDGAVCIKRDGLRVDFGQASNSYCALNIQTMKNNANGLPDDVYLKQGIYQSDSWDGYPSPINHVAYFGPARIGEYAGDVGW